MQMKFRADFERSEIVTIEREIANVEARTKIKNAEIMASEAQNKVPTIRKELRSLFQAAELKETVGIRRMMNGSLWRKLR